MSAPGLAIIAGAGGAMGASLINVLAGAGYDVAAIARNAGPDGPATWYTADLANVDEASETYDQILGRQGAPSVLIYNAHRFLIEPFDRISIEDFEDVWRTDTLGAVIAARSLLPGMQKRGAGTILFSGATASIRGSARFSAFASAKFALRGFAQSLAREFGPQGIHVAHIVIDGLIDGGHAQKLFYTPPEDCIAPLALANAYLALINQPDSAWTHELDIRPLNGKF